MSSKFRTRRERNPVYNGIVLTPSEVLELGIHP